MKRAHSLGWRALAAVGVVTAVVAAAEVLPVPVAVMPPVKRAIVRCHPRMAAAVEA